METQDNYSFKERNVEIQGFSVASMPGAAICPASFHMMSDLKLFDAN